MTFHAILGGKHPTLKKKCLNYKDYYVRVFDKKDRKILMIALFLIKCSKQLKIDANDSILQ